MSALPRGHEREQVAREVETMAVRISILVGRMRACRVEPRRAGEPERHQLIGEAEAFEAEAKEAATRVCALLRSAGAGPAATLPEIPSAPNDLGGEALRRYQEIRAKVHNVGGGFSGHWQDLVEWKAAADAIADELAALRAEGGAAPTDSTLELWAMEVATRYVCTCPEDWGLSEPEHVAKCPAPVASAEILGSLRGLLGLALSLDSLTPPKPNEARHD